MTDADPTAAALEAAQADLAANMVPWPDDYMEDLSPPGALFLLRQVAMCTEKIMLGAAVSLEAAPEEEGGVLAEAMNGVAMAVAGATHALVVLEVLPKAAEDVVTEVLNELNDTQGRG